MTHQTVHLEVQLRLKSLVLTQITRFTIVKLVRFIEAKLFFCLGVFDIAIIFFNYKDKVSKDG